MRSTAAGPPRCRPLKLADGQPNITGDWGVEQLVLTVPPSGGNGSMIPKSQSPAFAAGKITLAEVQATQPPRPKANSADRAANPQSVVVHPDARIAWFVAAVAGKPSLTGPLCSN